MKSLTSAIVLMTLSISSITGARADRFDEIAGSAMSGGRPTAETAKLLKDELLFQRATQIYLYALPLINTLGMKTGSEEKFGAGYNAHRSAPHAAGAPDREYIFCTFLLDRVPHQIYACF